jgi:hypothetical protein
MNKTFLCVLCVSATAPALLYLLHPCSRRQLLGLRSRRDSTDSIHGIVLRCSRLWLPASLYRLHPWRRTSCDLHGCGECQSDVGTSLAIRAVVCG